MEIGQFLWAVSRDVDRDEGKVDEEQRRKGLEVRGLEVRELEVRELNEAEVLPALHLIWEVFVEDVAPFYKPEGIEEFKKTIEYETVLGMYKNKELTMFGAFEDGGLEGTISVKNTGHILLFYVKKSCQGKGTGRKLFNAVYRHCAEQPDIRQMTVNAAPGAVPKYIHMGMRPVMPEQRKGGIRYTPMEMPL